jgi:hypothetical protein
VCRARDNCIRDLPADLDRLTGLEILDLRHNLLQVPPPPAPGDWRATAR